jgi:hypothetical protein
MLYSFPFTVKFKIGTRPLDKSSNTCEPYKDINIIV